ncbi:hypothetical protein I4U23_022513 [Adineta vaga]|nr:hypothetical protein I4U23_022513 [Adineta vaga]
MNQNESKGVLLFLQIFLILCFAQRHMISSLPLMNAIGNWTIIESTQHPEFNDVNIRIKYIESVKCFIVGARLINSFGCSVKFDPTTSQWKSSSCSSTEVGILDDKLEEKESKLFKFIENIQKMDIHSGPILIIETNNGEVLKLVPKQQ